MLSNRYGSFLTVILIIVIVALLVGIGFIVYNDFIKPNMTEKKSAEAIAQFDESFIKNDYIVLENLQ